VDIVTTKGEEGVTKNLEKKQMKADLMFVALIREMNNIMSIKTIEKHVKQMEVPSWL
jgi:hypothetical protein